MNKERIIELAHEYGEMCRLSGFYNGLDKMTECIDYSNLAEETYAKLLAAVYVRKFHGALWYEDHDVLKREAANEGHTGFCMGDFELEDCEDCPTLYDCLNMFLQDRKREGE